MAERTKKGEDDRKREDAQLTGTPTDAPPKPESQSPEGTSTTRDRGKDPAADEPKPGGRGDRT
jgi:hypothetical protein